MEKMFLKLPGNDDFFTQEAYKTLRTNLQFCGQDIQVIAVTSCQENEGKTTVTLNLAQSLTALGKKVLVIDADMRKSVIAGRYTNVKNPTGLSEILTGMVNLADAMYATQYAYLHLIFSGQYPPNPVELLSGRYFKAMLSESRKVYDYVLIDTPPLGRVIDAAVIASDCDGVILVMADNSVRSSQAQDVVDQLKKSGSKILGVVRNSVGAKSRQYPSGNRRR
ncbi:MAG: CpsD/CapB family tyrosine-protein kinase [Oscillospiraceae bacterium]|nr:CpsD/CapB family tyrosine-protein kinase [Oscillospiraceae bacterium]